MLHEFAGSRQAKPEDLDRAIPAAHNLGRLQAVMNHAAGLSVLKAAADLPSNVEKVPDRKSLFASQHGGDAVSLHVLHRGTELALDFARAIDWSDVRAT